MRQPSISKASEGFILACSRNSNQLPGMDRRRFLWSAAASTVCPGVAVAQREPSPEVIRLGPPERPSIAIEAWNLGLITAHRPDFTPAENQARNGELWCDLAPFCGRLLVRGRYVENWGSLNRQETVVEAFLVFGNSDDSGNLKGLLRKLGRKFSQDAVIHKPYYWDAQLYALTDLPGLGMSDRDMRSLGRFRTGLVSRYLTLLIRQSAYPPPLALDNLRLNADYDWLGGRWIEIGFWAYRGGLYAKPRLHQVRFDDTGINDEV
jgi:hypothetical protein